MEHPPVLSPDPSPTWLPRSERDGEVESEPPCRSVDPPWRRYLPLIAGALAYQLWAILQWRVNFDSDEAIVGLMARHILAGQIPRYFYGQQYLGSLDALLSAPLLAMLGEGVPFLRLTALLWFAAFLVLHVRLTTRWFGPQVAWLSLLLLSFPGWRIITVTSKASLAFGAMAVIGTSLLVLAVQLRPQGAVKRNLRLAGIGVLAGLGLWVHPMTVLYLAATLLILWLRLPEWQWLHERLTGAGRPAARTTVGLVAALAAGALVVVALFSDRCTPVGLWDAARLSARLLLVAAALFAIGSILAVSTRRRALLLSWLIGGAGFALGNAPQWSGWLADEPPSSARLPSCLLDAPAQARLLTIDLLPALWGTPGLDALGQEGAGWAVLWVAILAVCTVAVLVFLLRHRRDLLAAASLAPLATHATAGVVLAVLFFLPIGLVLVNANAYEPRHTRYLVVTWQASSVVVALLLRQAMTRSRVVGTLAALLLAVPVATATLTEAPDHWAAEKRHTGPQAVAELEQFLAARGVEGGFAGYWSAYLIDYFSRERLVVAPFGTDRYPAYTRRVAALPEQAYLLPPGLVPAGVTRGADLLPAVTVVEEGPPLQVIRDSLPTRRILARERVGDWEVFIVAPVDTAHP